MTTVDKFGPYWTKKHIVIQPTIPYVLLIFNDVGQVNAEPVIGFGSAGTATGNLNQVVEYYNGGPEIGGETGPAWGISFPADWYKNVAINCSVVPSSLIILNAPMTSNGDDIISPAASYTTIGTPTFSGAGMLVDAGDFQTDYITYGTNTTGAGGINAKVGAINWPTQGVSYTTEIYIDTATTFPSSTDTSRIFTIYDGSGKSQGFAIGTGGELIAYGVAGTSGNVGLGIPAPASGHLELRYEAGSDQLKYILDGITLYTASYVGRYYNGLIVGTLGLAYYPKMTFKNTLITITV